MKIFYVKNLSKTKERKILATYVTKGSFSLYTKGFTDKKKEQITWYKMGKAHEEKQEDIKIYFSSSLNP